MPSHYVAVLRQNLSAPTVYGFGATEQEARADAQEWTDGAADLVVFPCSAELAERETRKAGNATCEIVDGVACVVGESNA